MSTKVILSSSSFRDYAFPVGIAALLWREVVGYEPFVFLCGDGVPQVVENFLSDFGIRQQSLPQMEGYPVSVTAQNCRYHASTLTFGSDDWLMLSDADIFPLKRDFYHQHEGSPHRFVFYYSNGDNYANYPTCHIAAQASQWRELMKLDVGFPSNLLAQMKLNIDEWLHPRVVGLPPSKAGMETWMVDMWMFMDRIKKEPWHPSECKMIEREGHPPKDRLDRSNWPALYNLKDYTDAHILKAPEQPENWARLRPIVAELLPQHLSRIDKFHEDFINARR